MIATETRPPKGYTWGEITIERWELVDGARVVELAPVPGLLHECGYLGLHKPVVEGFGLWTVTHIPSGQKIATLPTQAAGRGCITSLLALPGLASTGPDLSTLSSAMAVVSDLQSSLVEKPTPSRRRKPTRQPGIGPSSFSPVFQGYVPTPANRAAQNKAALALGKWWDGEKGSGAYGLLEQAAAIAWREEIMVRVTQAPRALLLETDIPTFPSQSPTSPLDSGTASLTVTKRPLSGATLRDGTPATPGEFRRRYQALLAIGDRLQQGSIAFSKVYAEGEASGWPVPLLEKWEVLDERFRSIVREGWLIWSGAAFCFDCAPLAFQQNVVAKLGFIGSREQGWHELGIKTFLRWPEVAQVQPLRRELREKILEEL